MKTFLKIVAGLVVLGALGFAAVMYFTSGQRELAKGFVMDVSNGAYAEARDRLHPALAQEFPVERFAELFDTVQPYVEVSFSGIESSGNGTTLEGTASTALDCSSQVSFVVLDGKIIAFEITPLCPK